jgi:GWxTD domain-containing protein
MENHLVSSPKSLRRTVRTADWVSAALVLTACGRTAVQVGPQQAVTLAPTETSVLESTDPYRRGGFLVGEGALPFVGISRYFATESPDTTIVLVALSIPPRGLSFVRAGDRYAAYYSVKVDIMSGPTLIKTERPGGEVRVASIDETKRGDEGIIFQRSFRISPGNYSLHLTVQDSIGAGAGSSTAQISVPRLATGDAGSLLPVYAAMPRDKRGAPLLATVNPRATLRYGHDAAVQLYLEKYGRGAIDTLVVTSAAEHDSSRSGTRDTIVIARDSDVNSIVFPVSVASLELGLNRITATSANGTAIASSVVRVSIGEDIPVSTFNELWGALKYFATDAELRDLREASPEKRPSRWAALMKRTDPNPATPENEALREYARRTRIATARYREDSRPAWETDRGAVLVALGEPDIISNPAPVDSTPTRVQTWEYRRHRLLLVFYDQGGLGKWRLTTYSEADLKSLLSIAGPCVGCS